MHQNHTDDYDPAADIVADLEPDTDPASDQLLAFMQDAAALDNQRETLRLAQQYRSLTSEEQAKLDDLDAQGAALLEQARQQGLLPPQ